MARVVTKSCFSRRVTASQAFLRDCKQVEFWSLLRAAGVVNGMCLILGWEMDPESQASGARHQPLIQSLGTDTITHIEKLFYAIDCVTNLAWHVWSLWIGILVLTLHFSRAESSLGTLLVSARHCCRLSVLTRTLPCLCHTFDWSAHGP